MLWNLFVKVVLALAILISAINISGCGGGASAPVEPIACTDTVWSPDPATVAHGDHFTQTSNCGTTRDAVGTMITWQVRTGASMASVFKTFSTAVVSVKHIASDCSGGILVSGESSATVNNKIVVERLGSQNWRQLIDAPFGNISKSQGIFCDGTRVVPMYSRSILKDWLITGLGMNGTPFALAEVNIGYALNAATLAFDGDNLLIGRVHPVNAPAPPIPFSDTMLTRNNMVALDVFSVSPLVDPINLSVDQGGVIVVGLGQYMKYSHDLATVLTQPTILMPNATSVAVHSVVTTSGGATYIAGVADGMYWITQVGNPAFRNTLPIQVGVGQKVKLGCDSASNLFVSIENRLGRVNMTNGDMMDYNPITITSNADWVISGSVLYALRDTQVIETLNLDQIK